MDMATVNISASSRQQKFHFTLQHLLLGVLYLALLLAFYRVLLTHGPYRADGYLFIPYLAPYFDSAAGDAKSPSVTTEAGLELLHHSAFYQFAARSLVNDQAQLAQRPFFSADWLQQHVVVDFLRTADVHVFCDAPTWDEAREAVGAMILAYGNIFPPAWPPQANGAIPSLDDVMQPSAVSALAPAELQLRREVVEHARNSPIQVTLQAMIGTIGPPESLDDWLTAKVMGGTLLWAIVGWCFFHRAFRRAPYPAATAC
jgi:hypothetical protein